jgi:hypothetical protein
MGISFIERTNEAINKLVDLSVIFQSNHVREDLFIPSFEIDEYVNDTNEENLEETEAGFIDFSQVNYEKTFDIPSSKEASRAVVAVDSGVVALGNLASGGTVFAVRGAAVCYPNNGDLPFVCRYNTGVLVVDNKNVYPLSHYMGARLGKEDLFVKISESPPYYNAKSSMTDTSNQIQDRCRNFVERMIQEEAISILKAYGGGILLIDGALSGGTYDTPETYMKNLLSNCRDCHINVVAISKKTRISVGGRPIATLFEDQPQFVGFAKLNDVLEKQREAIEDDKGREVSKLSLADSIYAVRFGYHPGITFRVDVHPAMGLLSDEVLNRVYSSCLIYGGYPLPLIEAHQYSSFLFQDVQSLITDAVVRLGVRPLDQPTMEVLFQPFGAKNK